MKKHHIIVSHGNCPDGAAAVVVAKKIERHCEHVAGLHGKVDEQILSAARRLKKDGQLWITDICCDHDTLLEVFKILKEKSASIGVYEHHISRDYLKDVTLPDGLDGEIVFDLHRCGSRIFYEAMKPRHASRLEGMDKIIELTNDRDLWINADIRSAEFSSLHAILGEDRYIQRLQKNCSAEFSEQERTLLDYEKELMMRRMHHLISKIELFTDSDGLKYGVMIGEGKASEICNTAIHKYNVEYVFLLDFNSGRASVRSDKIFDCSTYAQSRGGGGHERAAGFPLTTPSFTR